jgi:hypothetical protein
VFENLENAPELRLVCELNGDGVSGVFRGVVDTGCREIYLVCSLVGVSGEKLSSLGGEDLMLENRRK